MYDLFEFVCLLNVGGDPSDDDRSFPRRHLHNSTLSCAEMRRAKHQRIHCFAWSNNPRCNYLALGLTNWSLLLYRLACGPDSRPLLKHFPWFHHPSKQAAVMCFDPTGCWLLIATRDGTLYLLPALFFVDPVSKMESEYWSTEDVTEIKLPGRRALPTTLCWWQTSDGQPVAIVGNELGEISFVDLRTRSEVGGTYITVCISEMEIIEDEANTRTYLLVSGTNAVQWQLVLEQQSTDYRWPLDNSSNCSGKKDSFKSSSASLSASILSCLSLLADERAVTNSAAEKDTRPKRLAQFSGHTHLQSQRFRGRTYVSGYSSAKSVLSVHCADLHVSPLFVYGLPLRAQYIVLSDRLMFVVSADHDQRTRISIVCTELAGSTLDGRRVYADGVSLMQSFAPVVGDRVLGMLAMHSPVGGEGCVVITRHNVYALRPRMSPDDLFLDTVLNQANYAKADHLARILCLDASFLYEKAAERKLSQSQVADAVRLYEMGKCPHVRSVANFAAHGLLSELLSYVRLLFAKRSSDFPPGDLKHFSNVALYCFVQQTLKGNANAVGSQLHNFREFLLDNQHYDEFLAVHLLCAYGIYDLMLEVAARRGLIPHMLSEILPSREELVSWRDGEIELRPKWVDVDTCKVFRHRGYAGLVSLLDNDFFIKCLLHKHLPMYIGLCPDLIHRLIALAKFLIPLWSNNCVHLKDLLCIYNPTSPFMMPILYDSLKKGDSSYSLMVTNKVSDSLNDAKMDDRNLSQEMTKLFLDLLVLLAKADNPSSSFDSTLVVPKHKLCGKAAVLENSVEPSSRLRLPRRGVRIGCGYAHAAAVINGEVYTWGRSLHGCLGRGYARKEWSQVEAIPLLRSPSVCVLSVSCGAAHTLAMTDAGVFAWGLNCYGQLGIGDTDSGMSRKRCHPTLVTTLTDVDVVSVACGQYHSLALSADGNVYSWGWGVYGQLGHGDHRNVEAPKRLEAAGVERSPVSRIAAGYAHTVLLSAEGDVFVCGCGTFGQLGSGKPSKETSPIKVDLPEGVTLAAAGYFHNVAVCTSGQVYSWGCHPQTLRLRAQVSRRMRNLRAATSVGVTVDSVEEAGAALVTPIYDPSDAPGVFSPAPVVLDPPLTSGIVHVSCGATHSLLLTADGEVLTWGRNLDGQLGHENRRERPTPAIVGVLNDRRIVQGACGADFTVLLDDTGRCWGLGIDDYGQITGAVDSGGSKDTANSNSTGKILTVRTNKRVVQIKSPTRHGVYKPVVLTGLPPINTPVKSKMMSQELPDSKVHSFREPLVISAEMHLTNELVHSALEQLYDLYDVDSVIDLCRSHGNLQGAAKVFFIDRQFQQSFMLNLNAITASDDVPGECRAEMALNLFSSYLGFIQDDVKVLQNVLKSIILFWSLHTLETEKLEQFFRLHVSKFLCPLSLILFSGTEADDGEGGRLNYVTSRLSTTFCMSLVNEILDKVKAGRAQPEVIDMLSNVVNLDRMQLRDGDVWSQVSAGVMTIPSEQVATDHLWTELTQNLFKDINGKSHIDLSDSDVEHLLRDADVADDGDSARQLAAVFTCGHHHSWNAFRTVVLQRFKDSLSESLPQMTRNLLNVYSNEGFQPMACPQCLAKSLQEEKI